MELCLVMHLSLHFITGIASAQLLNIMNLAFETGTAPHEWTKSIIIPILKQGDLTEALPTLGA